MGDWRYYDRERGNARCQMQQLSSVETFHGVVPGNIGERHRGLRCADLVKLNYGMLARRGHPRCHCNEEGFGTLSRQLGNDGGYRSSRVGVSGCFSCRARQHL